MAERLSEEQLRELDTTLPGWRVVDGRLHREIEFEDFVGAFGFMTSMALVAQQLDHHPDWSNSWNRVTIDLTTHSAGGLTELDVEMARTANRFLGDPG